MKSGVGEQTEIEKHTLFSSNWVQKCNDFKSMWVLTVCVCVCVCVCEDDVEVRKC